MKKWKKLITLVEWLNQGRTLKQDGVNYTLSENNDIIHMWTEKEGILVPLPALFKIVNKITDQELTIMLGEIALTQINKNDTKRRNN